MAHLERNLLPTWPILLPSWAHLRPNFAKNLHQIAPESQEAPPNTTRPLRGSPEGFGTAPGARILMVLGSIVGLVFNFFSSVYPSILDGLPASIKARGGLARAAHCIYPPPPGGVAGRV